MAALVLVVVELMAKHTATRLTGLVEMIRGLANPKSGGARQEVHSRPVNIGGSGGQGPAEMPGAG